jgi:hypothetical protein
MFSSSNDALYDEDDPTCLRYLFIRDMLRALRYRHDDNFEVLILQNGIDMLTTVSATWRLLQLSFPWVKWHLTTLGPLIRCRPPLYVQRETLDCIKPT